MIIRANICVSDIDKSRIHTSEKNGKKYLTLSLLSSKNPQYGDDGYVVVDISKEEREGGAKAPIIGNWKWIVRPDADSQAAKGPVGPFPKPAALESPEDSDLPF